MSEQGESGAIKNGHQVTLDQQADQGALLVGQFIEAMHVLGLENDPRCRLLAHCQSFYAGTQHDHHGMNWDAIPRDPGVGYLHERLAPQGFVPVNSMGYGHRKPDAPVPLARQVVSRFTEMLLGEGRRPSLRVHSDKASEDYLEACFKEAEVWDALAEARDMAGSCGSAAIAIGLNSGQLCCEVLNPKHLYVVQWCPESNGWWPDCVVEQYRMTKRIFNPASKCVESVECWRTRMWTTESVIYYQDAPVGGEILTDMIALQESHHHGLGFCPVVWYQNTRSTKDPDGRPDCDTVWPLLDKLDRLQSQVYKAAIANTDPTLVIKEDRQNRRRGSNIIQKGSNHVIPISPQGDVKYLELEGSSVRLGLEAINALVSEVLQTVECVVISPEYARAYQSGEALQMLWRAMEARASRLRVTLSRTVRDLAYVFLAYGNRYPVRDVEKVGTAEDAAGILLPPRRVMEELRVPDSPVPGEPKPPAPPLVARWEPHRPGNENAYVTVEWPPYWAPTPMQVKDMVAALSLATGGKQIVSVETGARQVAQILGRDGDEEVRRIEEEKNEGLAAIMRSAAVTDALSEDENEDEEDEGEEEDTDEEEALESPKKDKGRKDEEEEPDEEDADDELDEDEEDDGDA